MILYPLSRRNSDTEGQHLHVTSVTIQPLPALPYLPEPRNSLFRFVFREGSTWGAPRVLFRRPRLQVSAGGPTMTTSLRRFSKPLLLTLLVCTLALSAFADPPGRAVRIKYISGAVSMQPGGINDWVTAEVNRPLTTSDRVWTDKEARAELHLGSAALRMNAETSLTFTNVNDDIVQVELDQGTLNIHIRHLFGGETYEIDTPNQAFTIMKAGDYRFDVDPNADTTSITVWRGEGEANGQGPGVKLKSGHQATFSGGTSMQHESASAPGLDGFDDWCRVRDDREDHARSYQYVSADVVGADELDE